MYLEKKLQIFLKRFKNDKVIFTYISADYTFGFG